jgi:hypothetical protein
VALAKYVDLESIPADLREWKESVANRGASRRRYPDLDRDCCSGPSQLVGPTSHCSTTARLVLNCLITLANSSARDVDFNQYYSAGKLVGSGRLYDWSSIRALELRIWRVH